MMKDATLTDLDQEFGTDVSCIELAEFLALELPPRELILSPIIPTQGVVMIHAPRGIGKTHVSLGIGYAVASGGSFLRYTAPKARGVLFIDGEMPGNALQERLANIVTQPGSKPPGAPLQIITPDLQEYGIPDLCSIDGQQAISKHITDDIELIILDNLSTLVRSGKENEGESWQPIQDWALNLRSKGKAVLFIHHSGKGGQQRGTSRREDILDTVIGLKRPSDYSPQNGAQFEVNLEKGRGIHGEDSEPFVAQLITDERGDQSWVTQSLADSNFDKIVRLFGDGLSQKDISIELGINKSNVSRNLKKAKELGLIQS